MNDIEQVNIWLEEQIDETNLQFHWAMLYKKQRDNLIKTIKSLEGFDSPMLADEYVAVKYYEFQKLVKLAENEGNLEGDRVDVK